MIRVATCSLLILMSAAAQEIRGRLAAWDGGTGAGLFVVVGETGRYVVGYEEPLPREGWDPKKPIKLGFWVRVPTKTPPPEWDDVEYFADRLIVEAPAEPWVTAICDYVDELLVAVFAYGDRERMRKLLPPGRADLEATLVWFLERRSHPRGDPTVTASFTTNLRGWVLMEIGTDRLRAVTNPTLCYSGLSLNLELRWDGGKVVLERAAAVDGERYEEVFSTQEPRYK